MPDKVLRKFGMGRMTKKDRDDLVQSKLFKRTGYTKGYESMRYGKGPELEQLVFDAMVEPIKTGDLLGIKTVDVETGEPAKPRESNLKGEPRLTQKAFKKIINQVDVHAIQDHFESLYDEYLNCSSPNRAVYLKKKIMSNMQAFESLIIQGIDDKNFTYTPAYKGCSTGRMYEMGGIQGMSRDFKKAAWESTEAINYDIRSCQIASLLEFDGLKDSTRETLEGYVGNPNAKEEYAGRVGIDVDLWKQSLLSLFNGAGIWESIYEEILIWDFGIYRHTGKEVHDKFVEVAESFIEARKDWFKVIKGIVAKKSFIRNGTRYVKNRMRKPTSDLNDTSFLSAFFLQGVEAKFIFTLIDLSSKYDYQVLGNEHDGLVTMGIIPPLAIEEAKELTGLNKLELIPKDW
jgi:hypothetical protein